MGGGIDKQLGEARARLPVLSARRYLRSLARLVDAPAELDGHLVRGPIAGHDVVGV